MKQNFTEFEWALEGSDKSSRGLRVAKWVWEESEYMLVSLKEVWMSPTLRWLNKSINEF